MTTDLCFECSNKDSILCSICGIAKDGAREHFNQKPITNADRIRSKTDEELANFYFDFFFPQCPYCECDPGKPRPEHNDCKICLLEWLKEETTE